MKKKRAFVTTSTKYYGQSINNICDLISEHEFVSAPKKCDVVLFTGGEDVDPSFYGDTSPHRVCSYNTNRDKYEMEIYNIALANQIPMAGICRGLQLLNVMVGGKLMHHLSDHNGTIHDMTVSLHSKVIQVNSLHHQMVIPPNDNDTMVIGWATKRLSKVYVGDEDVAVKYDGVEVEAAIFPKIKGFAVQYHPEAMETHTRGYRFFNNMVATAMRAWEEFISIYAKARNSKAAHT